MGKQCNPLTNDYMLETAKQQDIISPQEVKKLYKGRPLFCERRENAQLLKFSAKIYMIKEKEDSQLSFSFSYHVSYFLTQLKPTPEEILESSPCLNKMTDL